MYKSFFGLTRNPFELSPDPTCFISTKQHDEALATLYYGVRRHKGFIVITGEVGTGKTLLLRCLLELLKESNDIAYSYVFNSRMNPSDFLRYMIADFGIPAADKSKSELLLTFSAFLASRGAQHLTTVLVVDEANDLSEDLLEEIRLLSNIETTQDKLLQILLIGQPELDAKLDSVGLRQLKQRIALRARLGALSISETASYIRQRMEIAGAAPERDPVFAEGSIEEIFRFSSGIPRLINTLCENALISAYAKQSLLVTPDVIRAVAHDFRLNNDDGNGLRTWNANDQAEDRAPFNFAARLHGSATREHNQGDNPGEKEAV